MIAATIQLCTYNRAALLERVLEACFDQTVPDDSYEVVLVDDGSSDGTPSVIERARSHAPCAFTVVSQENRGLAGARNAGIARATGERIIFIDDDVLVLPNFVAEHLRSHAASPAAIVRGGAIEVESLDDLPPPVWSIKNYSGNYFWTTNVSAPLATIRAIGGFDESFSEYGWEDIDVGLRLRARGVKAVFNPRALVLSFQAAASRERHRGDGCAGASQSAHRRRARAPPSALARLSCDGNQSGPAPICGMAPAAGIGRSLTPPARGSRRARADAARSAARALARERGLLRRDWNVRCG